MRRRGSIGRFAKRGMDLCIAAIGLVLLLVPFCVIALAIKLNDAGPVFFRQERIGRSGRRFLIWKLRTMVIGEAEYDPEITASKDDERITKAGRILRNWGLDELPQLFNVLKGEMSLVGPRPTLAHQVAEYNNFQRRRLEVKPGPTGLAVVSGRNALSWETRIELDIHYIDHWSFWLDARILFRTLWKVLIVREGIYGVDGVNESFVPVDHPDQKAANRDAHS